jgi:hypothetical protein
MTTSIVEGRKEKIPLYGSLRMDAPPMARADGSLTSSSSSRPTGPASRPATPCS